MTLYERMKLIAAQYDLLNAEHHKLNQSLRELIIEAQIEKHGYTKSFRKFVRYMTLTTPFKN